MWTISDASFDPKKLWHRETIYTIGNGYLSTRGAFEEGYPGDRRATFIHGVFDAVPIAISELANAPDWLPLTVYLEDERFSLATGTLERFACDLDLRTGVLRRTVRWRSPAGRRATLTWERLASLADEHTLFIRCQVTPEFAGRLEFRAALNGNVTNEGLAHWEWLGQGWRGERVYLHSRTRTSKVEVAEAMRFKVVDGREFERAMWDAENMPTLAVQVEAAPGQAVTVEKRVAVFVSRDPEAEGAGVVEAALARAAQMPDWPAAYAAQGAAWAEEWERTDLAIEGDPEAQIALRFNLFQLLIAAPRHDDRVNIGAKTLSGFGYRGHAFWDTEIFMLPLFIYTAPQIARNLLNYRYRHLPAARQKARAGGYEGAQFAWESADTGEEVTPTWIPHFSDRKVLVRIWTADIEIHISADIAYAAHLYWRITGDDAWFIEKGAELILDTAKFWAARAQWNAARNGYEYTDVIGPDEYHEHVNNNVYTNRLAQWNLETALAALDWLKAHAPAQAARLTLALGLSETQLAHWRDVIDKIILLTCPTGLMEQFEGYFQRQDVRMAELEPRSKSVQEVFGIEGANQTQAVKQPDVLMLLYLLRGDYADEVLRVNYDYYNPRTDHTFGSSLGPSIQSILACEVGDLDGAYEHFLRAARADLHDARGNAGDGIHGASAGGTWQSVVFGFAGLRVNPAGWTLRPRLPRHWKRLTFKFFWRGNLQTVDLKASEPAP